jgi:integrase
LLDLAVKKGAVPLNHARGLKPLRRDGVSANNKKKSLTLDQISEFFQNSFYKSCARASGNPYEVADQKKYDWRFWLPLMCLFMGMRPNEVCQLRRGDILTTKAGVLYVNVTASGEKTETGPKQTLKTASSRRKIPVHPELLAIGFAEFVSRRSEDNALLFSVRLDKYGNHARYSLKRFRETFLPAAIKLEPKQSFYSFRHSFRDALRRIGAPDEILRAFGGWSNGTPVSDAYGDKYDPDHTAAHMSRIAYPGVDLSHLHTKG